MTSNAQKKIGVAIAITAAFVISACGGAGGTSSGPINADMSGGSAQGYFRVLGETMNSIVRDEYPGSSIAYIPGSPAGALAQVAQGEIDLAVASSPVEERLANAGEPPFEESLEGQYQCIMQIHEEQVLTSVANKEWAERYGIESWADVAEKKPPMRVNINQQGNVQMVLVAEDYFKEHGFGFEDIEAWGGEIAWVGSGEGASLLRDRKVDVFFNAGFVPHSAIQEVVASGLDLTWISLEEEKVQAVTDKWDLSTTSVTPEEYEFVTKEEPAVRWPTDLTVNAEMSEDEVYRFTKAIFDNADKMQGIHPSMKEFSAENGAKCGDRVQFHPGAQRYYEEVGVL